MILSFMPSLCDKVIYSVEKALDLLYLVMQTSVDHPHSFTGCIKKSRNFLLIGDDDWFFKKGFERHHTALTRAKARNMWDQMPWHS